MTDIFDEVGEDLRRDRLKRFWQRWGWAVILFALLVVAATAGWRIYEHFERTAAAEAGDRFEAALAAAAGGEDPLAAAAALEAFAADAPAVYAALATFRAASEHAAAGEIDNAFATFERLSADGSIPKEFRDLAAIRAAMLAVDREDLASVRSRVAGYDTETNPWRHSAREIVALAAVKAEAWEEAREMARKIVADTAAPRGIVSRARIVEQVVESAVGPAPKQEGAGS